MSFQGQVAGAHQVVLFNRLAALVDVVPYMGDDILFILGELALDAAQVRFRTLQELFGAGLVVGNIAACHAG